MSSSLHPLRLCGEIIQVSISPTGGLPKYAVTEAFLTPLGFQGDAVAHPAIHGGPRKAVLVATSEGIDELIARGYPLFYGALGENLTTRGLDRRALRAGMRLRCGKAVIELTQLRRPCDSLDIYGADLQRALDPSESSGLGGFYAAVVEPGWVRVQDAIAVLDVAV